MRIPVMFRRFVQDNSYPVRMTCLQEDPILFKRLAYSRLPILVCLSRGEFLSCPEGVSTGKFPAFSKRFPTGEFLPCSEGLPEGNRINGINKQYFVVLLTAPQQFEKKIWEEKCKVDEFIIFILVYLHIWKTSRLPRRPQWRRSRLWSRKLKITTAIQ